MPLMPVQRDDFSAAFFDATVAGRLLVRRCTNGHYLGGSLRAGGLALQCPTCQTTELAWVQASGDAALVSWTVVHPRDDSPPTVAGIVELREGPWMYGLLDVPPTAELRAGQPLAIGFVSSGAGGELIPAFKPT
jgi:uncharacterized OB-fold protein